MKQTLIIMLIVVITAFASILYVSQPVWHHQDEPLSTVRVGLLPRENWEEQKQQFEPLMNYLSMTTGMNFRLVRSGSYDELLQQFIDHEIDMANFGGLTFVQALQGGHAKPLVMRDVSLTVTSVFIVPSGSNAQSLSDMSGKRLCFGSKRSTAGHLMPRYFLRAESDRIVPENYFSEICYTGAHDKTAYAVRDGKADIGVIKSTILKKMLADGRLQTDDVRVLWQTPPFPDGVWAIHDHIAQETQTKIINAFLELDPQGPIDKKILSLLNANYYVPARHSVFDPLASIAKEFGLIEP
jgi:phosphonate transport system substrate-binding protein